MNSFFYMEEAPKIKTRPTNKARKEEPYVDETWERVAKRILYLCRLKKITLNTLALRSGLTPSTLKSILYGTSRNPGIATIRHIYSIINFYNHITIAQYLIFVNFASRKQKKNYKPI